MKYIKEYAFSALAILMASCSSDSDTIEPEAQKTPVASSNTMSFSASIASGETASKATRTSLADANTTSPYPIWSSGDQIKIINTTTADAQLFSITSSDVGKRAANFTGNIKVETGNNANNKFYAFYAGNVGASEGAPTIAMSGTNVTVSGTIPSTQSSTPAFNQNLHFMTACTTGSAFSFKNGMALMKVTIVDNNYDNFKICRIVFKSNDATEKIAGDFTATIGDKGTLSNYSVTNGSSQIVIDGGVNGLSTGTYYIAILPCAFSKGFTLAFEEYRSQDTHTEVFDRIKETAFNVDASEIINLGSYTAKECAKEAYVDLGITREIDGVTKKVLWCIENVYDEAGEKITGTNSTTTETDPTSSYYAWGENYVKSNQYKVSYCQNYSWYYTYSLGQGTTAAEQAEEAAHFEKRSYKYGIGNGSWNDAWESSNRWNFHPNTKGVLIKYNDYEAYTSSITDWGGGSADGKSELELMDDAAYQKSLKFAKNVVRIADEKDFDALWKARNAGTLNFVKVSIPSSCYAFQNKTTKSFILLPIGGYRYLESKDDDAELKDDDLAFYWTRNSSTGKDSYKAKIVRIRDSGVFFDDAPRCQGLMLRGVIYR